MSEKYQLTHLWKKSLGSEQKAHLQEIEGLRTAYLGFRTKADQLTSQIQKALPSLTVHGVTHLDALWETADLIAGPDYPLNPMEGFVLGGAILLHDAALCFEAYEGGVNGLRNSVEWKDAYVAASASNPSADQNSLEADFAAMRYLHAGQAKELAIKGWRSDAGELYLIDDPILRKCYGSLIGKIAESHNWPIERVASELTQQANAPGTFPSEWRVDPIKIACLLRCADAAHIDDRRAPDFLRALTRQRGMSESHWRAQNWLARADIDLSDPDGHTLLITSHRAFEIADADAWWVAYDALQLINAEIKASNDLLSARPQARKSSPAFQITTVSGTASIEETYKHIEVKGWKPCSAKIHVGNIERLIHNLGGANLYAGESFAVVIRELIQNARDAVVARAEIDADQDYQPRVRISLQIDLDDNEHIEVMDNGIGMSERVLTGPLLDFGTSFWITNLIQSEWPGLRSSQFRPVGHFGIGFYSVFMVASSVRVHSRRYDAALDEMKSICFQNGLTLRPILAQSELGHQGYSTVVSCRVKENIGESIEIKSGMVGHEDIHVQLSDYIASMVVGLDVKVEYKGPNDLTWRTIHEPIQSLLSQTDIKSWLERASFSTNIEGSKNIIEAHHDRLRPIIQEGEICGLAALSIQSADRPYHLAFRTVGGLRLPTYTHDNFIGFIDYLPNSAKRESSERPRATGQSIQNWADDQITILRSKSVSDLEWCHATMSLCDLGLDPTDIATVGFIESGKFFTTDLRSSLNMAMDKGIAIFKPASISIVETHTRHTHQDLPTFFPFKNGAFLDLNMDNNNIPCNRYSFIGCLYREAARVNCKLEFDFIKKVTQGALWPIDLMIVKAKASSN